MKIDQKKTFEVVGVIAVVFSLLFVAYEVRQANTIARVSMENEIRTNFASINDFLMGDPVLRELVNYKVNDPNYELTMDEQAIAGSWIRRLGNVFLPAIEAFESGMLTDATYQTIWDDVRISTASPGLREPWRQYINSYTGLSDTELIKFVKAELAKYVDD